MGKWRTAVIALVMVAGLAAGGCGKDETEQRAEDCTTAQDVQKQVQDDLRATMQDPSSISDLSKLKDAVARNSGKLRTAAGKVHDQKLKDALNGQAQQMDDFAKSTKIDPATFFKPIQDLGNAIASECTRAPGK